MYELYHHGINGQKWGVRNGPPYPIQKTRPSTGKILKKQKKLPRNATYQNLDSWGKSPKTNILYITGKSGSGKSTVATNLKDKNTEVIHLDSYFDQGNVSNKDFDKYLNRIKSDYKRLKTPKGKIDINEWGKVAERFENSIDDYGRDAYKRGKKVIVEGVQLLDDTVRPDKSYFKDKPLVLINTNSLISIKRANERDDMKFDWSQINDSRAWNKDIKNVRKSNKLKHEDITMYDYIIEKPDLDEDLLMHFGIKGMKWRKRKKSKHNPNAMEDYKNAVNRKNYARKGATKAGLEAIKFAERYKRLNTNVNLTNKGYISSQHGGQAGARFGPGIYAARKRKEENDRKERGKNAMYGDSRYAPSEREAKRLTVVNKMKRKQRKG